MPDTRNPYIPGQPVHDPNLFFGRRDELAAIREHVVKGRRVFVVSGAPRMGKTSLLRQLPAHLPETCVAVLVELLDEDAQHLDQLLYILARAIAQQLGRQLGAGSLEPAWDDFEGHTEFLLDRFWPRVRSALDDRCLVLMLDDLDSLAQAEGDLLDALVAFSATWRERDGDLAFVLTMATAEQEKLSRAYPGLFGGALSFVLGPLDSEMAARLITWPVDGVLTYDYGVARRLIEITSGQPYYLQLLCFEIFNRCAPAGWVNLHDVDVVVEELVGREIADFHLVWDGSSPQEQSVLAALVSLRGARGVATVQEVRTMLTRAGARVRPDQVASALDSLAARGILERLGALSYRFRVALLRDWLGERIDLQEVVRNTRWDARELTRSAEGRVVQLSPRRERRRKPPPAGEPPPNGAAEDEPAERPSAGRHWLWFAAAVVLILVLLAVVGPHFFQALPPEPASTVLSPASPTMRLATATLKAVPLVSTQPEVIASPTEEPTPLPAETPSPTPPLIVGRPVPSIAFQSRATGEQDWSICVMNSDGSSRTVLTEGQNQFLAPPTWSPDGTRIAFVSDRGGTSDIWVMDNDGTNLVNLTQDEAKDHSPAWSPDGEWIAFASVRDSVYWELYLMRPDGTDVQRLTWWDDASDLSPCWAPDGTRLAFASKRDGNWEIYAMDRDGSNLLRLTDNPFDDTNPVWSPEGSRIAFESTREGFSDLYLMPAIGGDAVNISNAPFSSEHGPTWSPDGGRIAFYSDRGGAWNIWVMISDGSDAVQLTGSNTNDQVPAWRP